MRFFPFAFIALAACNALLGTDPPVDVPGSDAGPEDDADNAGDASTGTNDSGTKPCGKSGAACCAPGDTCTDHAACASGKCACLSLFTACGGACADLTSDPKNCGTCGTVCESGTCSKGLCGAVTVANPPNAGLRELVMDATTLYFLNENTTKVLKCPKSGCGSSPTEIASGIQSNGMAVIGADLYMDNVNGSGAGSILRCSTAGCGTTPAVLKTGFSFLYDLASDGENIYWTAFDSSGSLHTCKAINCAATYSVLATTLTTLGSTGVLAAEAGSVYLGTSKGIYTCPKTGCAGGAMTKVTDTNVRNLIAFAGSLYWVDSTKTIRSCTATSCGTPQVVGTSTSPIGLATDGASLYFIDDLSSQVYKCPASGCGTGPSLFARDGLLPIGGTSIVCDGQSVFWSTGKSIVRLPK